MKQENSTPAMEGTERRNDKEVKRTAGQEEVGEAADEKFEWREER
jgi:hypothetical protein